MIPAWLSFLDGLLAIALVLTGTLGAHYYLVAPFLGFKLFLLGFLLSIVSVLSGILGLIRTAAAKRRAGLPRAIIGTILGLIVAVPVFGIIAQTRKYPPINDITTDVDNPPEFVHATELPANRGRDMKYDRAKYAAQQRRGYGDVVPLRLDARSDAAFAKVQIVAVKMPGWQITFTDPRTRTIEGVATSPLFHFRDDFVIQVRQSDAGASLVEMRSKSRDGIGDFGANYHRIETFFAELSAASAAS